MGSHNQLIVRLTKDRLCYLAYLVRSRAVHMIQYILSTASFLIRPNPASLTNSKPHDSLAHTHVNTYYLLCHCALLFLRSRLKRSVHGGCYSKVGLPLIENSSIVEQPLDLWTLTEQYKSAASRIIHDARYNTGLNRMLICVLRNKPFIQQI